MAVRGFNVSAAVAYARQWALSRNPRYYNFNGQGGDCTNFISQCLIAGGAPMNYTKDTGWYFSSASNRAAAWSSVEHFYRFLTTNKGVGPFGHVVSIEEVRTGDIIQLSFNGYSFSHTLFVTAVRGGQIFICTHSYDSLDRELSTYTYQKLRVLSIDGVR